MRRTSMGRLLVDEALPEEMRDKNRVLDKKGMNDLLRELAEKHPEKYVAVSKRLSDIGRTVATEFGGYSFGLEHMRTSAVAKKYRAEIQQKMQAILGNEKLTPKQRKDAIVKMVGGYQQKQIDEIYTEAVKANNPLALQVLSGSRGNKMNLGSLLGSDLLYSDHRDEVIPLPVMSSYSQGLKPIEYWASTYGARRGTMATKFATADSGFLSKQLNQVAHRLMVVGDDDDRDIPHRGLPVDTDDSDNEGALLASDVGPYKRNTVLTPKILKHLKGIGHDRLLVRSPLVGGSPDGGVYARDVGVRERGVLPGRGEMVGLTAAQALSEPLSQGQLAAKHSGGVAGQEKAVGGFAYINQLIQVPRTFKGGAAHAEYDGTVSSIERAPAGGHYVWIGDKRHYVPTGAELKVGKGDAIEAGDVLSAGFPNPAIVTQHKGIGEGKRYFVNAFRQAMQDAGMKVNRRNVELLARGLINHVRLTDEYGDHVPDDVVPYSTIEQLYEPRADHEVVRVGANAAGKYLEKPVLHYSVGTKVRPSVLKELQYFGVGEVAVHKEPPPFQAEMIRGMYSLQHDPDWMTRMYGSGLKKSLLDAAHHGSVSDELGTSFVPGLSRAVDFGRIGTVRQPEAGTELPPEGQPFGDPRKAITPSRALDIPDTKKPELKRTSSVSSMFKLSADDLEKEAAELLEKVAQPPKVDSTLSPNTGSSTGGQSPVTPMSTPPAAGPGPGRSPAAPMPAPSSMSGPPGGMAPPVPIQPPAPTGPPGSPNTPAVPGQVHPGRLQPGMISQNPWAGGVGSPAPSLGPANPDSFTQGFTPGEGLFSQMDDPAMAAEFVQGGGDPNDPSSGFGGEFGAVTRFGSLLDGRAVAALTGGEHYVNNEQYGAGHDNLMGGYKPQPIHGGMTWDGLLDAQGAPPIGSSPDQAAPAPAPAAPQAPAAYQPVQAAPVPGATVNTPLQDKNHFRNQMTQKENWNPGNPEFDALKAQLPPGTTDDQVRDGLYGYTRRMHAANKAGYVPGQEKFENARKQLAADVQKNIPNVDESIAETEQVLEAVRAADPNAPQVGQLTQRLAALKQLKEKGISDDDVYASLFESGAVDPNSVSEYDMFTEMRGDKSTAGYAQRLALNPYTGQVVFAGAGVGIQAGGVGGARMLSKVPVIRSIPGVEALAKKGMPKVAERMGLKAGAKMGFKRIPVLGWMYEGYEGATTPEDELRAKQDEQLNRLQSLNAPNSDTPGKLRDFTEDAVLNPGQNVASAVVTLKDADNLNRSTEQLKFKNSVDEAVLLSERIKNNGKPGFATYSEASIAQAQQRLDELNATNGGNAKGNFRGEVDRRIGDKNSERYREWLKTPEGQAAAKAKSDDLSLSWIMDDVRRDPAKHADYYGRELERRKGPEARAQWEASPEGQAAMQKWREGPEGQREANQWKEKPKTPAEIEEQRLNAERSVRREQVIGVTALTPEDVLKFDSSGYKPGTPEFETAREEATQALRNYTEDDHKEVAGWSDVADKLINDPKERAEYEANFGKDGVSELEWFVKNERRWKSVVSGKPATDEDVYLYLRQKYSPAESPSK